MNSNFILKVQDANLSDIRKALQGGGIQMRSIIELFSEKTAAPREEKESK